MDIALGDVMESQPLKFGKIIDKIQILFPSSSQ